MSNIVEFTNISIITEEGEWKNGSLQIHNGKITKLSHQLIGGADQVIDGKGKQYKLLPGFIDVHIHGANGFDVMDATFDALSGIARQLPKEGTTSFLATTMTQSSDAISKAVTNAGQYMESKHADGESEVLGIHLEGPFISKNKVGAQPIKHVMAPSVEKFSSWQEQSQGHIRLITLAPEESGAMELIKYVSSQGVTASIGHSDAELSVVNEAVEHGAKHVTHLFNQMRGLHHREPGVVGAAFLNEKLMVEMIVDRIHVHKDAIKLAYQHTKTDRTILITDAMRAKCLADGVYDLGGQDVEVKNGEARLEDGTLAGSILTLAEAARNMKEDQELSYEELAAITSANAAKQLGIFHRKGSIKEGKDADLVMLNEHGEVIVTVCNGTVAYDSREVSS